MFYHISTSVIFKFDLLKEDISGIRKIEFSDWMRVCPKYFWLRAKAVTEAIFQNSFDLDL